MPANVTGRIELADFRAGVFGDFHLGGASTPANDHDGAVPVANGAATIENTFRCSADRTGALVPLPRLGEPVLAGTMVGTREGDSEDSTAGFDGAFLVDAIVVDGVLGGTATEHAVLCMYRFFRLGRPYAMVRLHELHKGSTIREIHLTKNAASLTPTRITGGNFARVRGQDPDESIAPAVAWTIPAHREPGVSPFVPLVRENNTPSNSALNADEEAFSTYDTDTVRVGDVDIIRFPISYDGSVVGVYPDVTHNPTGGDDFGETTARDYRPLTPALAGAAMLVAGHQGRLVLARRPVNAFGGGEARVMFDEVTYTRLLRPELEEGTDVFGYESTSPIGLIASIGVDELVIIKQNHGGVAVRGDIRNPTVSVLPFVEPTRGVVAQPAFCPLGLVYGTRTGVWVWAGGEVSERISAQIDGFFWNVGEHPYDGNQGRFAWWQPWVVCPNSFLYDTRHQSWWRLEDPDVAAPNVFDVAGSDNRLYAFEHRLTETQTTAWRSALEHRLATSYSWQSQPLMETRDRFMSVVDIRLIATPSDENPATVTVTLTGYDQDGEPVAAVPTVFDVSGPAGRPRMLNRKVAPAFTAAWVQVRIEAEGGDPSGDTGAPKVHAMSVGHTDRQMIPRQDS